MLKINFLSFVSNYVGNLIKGGKYEILIEKLMNKSKVVFPKTYRHIETKKQNKGEPDFICIENGSKFDAKLILTTKQGEDLGAKSKNIPDYMNQIVQLNNEMYEYTINPKEHNIKETLLFKILKKLIDSIKNDENLIVLFTYPFMGNLSNSITDFVLVDYLDMVYAPIKNKFIDRNLYFIYPTIDNKIVLRKMVNKFNNNVFNVEFLDCENYFKYFKTVIN